MKPFLLMAALLVASAAYAGHSVHTWQLIGDQPGAQPGQRLCTHVCVHGGETRITRTYGGCY